MLPGFSWLADKNRQGQYADFLRKLGYVPIYFIYLGITRSATCTSLQCPIRVKTTNVKAERGVTMSYKVIVTLLAACALVTVATASAQLSSPSPALVSELTNKLSITPEQAIGGSGAIFGLARSRMKPEDFLRVSDSVPGMNSFLGAAPEVKLDPLTSATSIVPGKAGPLGSLAGSFNQLGLSPDMASKFVPVITEFVKGRGGKDVAKLFTNALK